MLANQSVRLLSEFGFAGAVGLSAFWPIGDRQDSSLFDSAGGILAGAPSGST